MQLRTVSCEHPSSGLTPALGHRFPLAQIMEERRLREKEGKFWRPPGKSTASWGACPGPATMFMLQDSEEMAPAKAQDRPCLLWSGTEGVRGPECRGEGGGGGPLPAWSHLGPILLGLETARGQPGTWVTGALLHCLGPWA